MKNLCTLIISALLCIIFTPALASCQSATTKPKQDTSITYVDKDGLWRWKDTNKELTLFGVNYCLPSGYTYRAVGYVGASHEKTIDHDTSHFARMGFDAIRLSFWGDWQTCDKDGNLIQNEHLRLLDYLIYRAKQKDIYMLLTPMVLYSPQWPEPEHLNKSTGISKFYKKAQMSTDPNAIKAQQNFLYQIMNHVNPYTNLAYKDEPAIIAVEMVNEPANPPTKQQTIDYINALAKAVRDTGCKKPLFYNNSQTKWPPYMEAVKESTVEGTTFAWYPTGLVCGHTLKGNFLPIVDDYPQTREQNLSKKAKLVYEFDAPDMAYSYMYPAMARTFRTGGIQWAAMFSYDPLPLAYCNTEYQTHYVNLIYTPQKAVGLIIASEAFHRLPRLKSYGSYPENTTFGPFRISYQENLSQMLTEKLFLYSSDTQSVPPNPRMLEKIIGCGSSPIVRYEGTGAYFLEKIQKALWRLQVYPDAVWINDPFERPRLDKTVSQIIYRQWPMKIDLPDLGPQFEIIPLNNGNSFNTNTQNASFTIRHGTYLLKQNSIDTSHLTPQTHFGRITLGQFITPPPQNIKTTVLHEPPRQIATGRKTTLTASVISQKQPQQVTLYARRTGHHFFPYPMQHQKGYQYKVELPPRLLRPGLLEYAISVEIDNSTRTFPADINGLPADWDFPPVKLWELTVVSPDTPIVLFDAKRDRKQILLPDRWHHVRYKKDFVPGMTPQSLALRIEVPSLETPPQDISCRYAFAERIDTRRQDLKNFDTLSVRIRADHPETKCQIALIEYGRYAWGTTLSLTKDFKQIDIPIKNLELLETAVMPRDFPRIFPYWEKHSDDKLNIEEIEALQISLSARLFPDRSNQPHAIEIETIVLK